MNQPNSRCLLPNNNGFALPGVLLIGAWTDNKGFVGLYYPYFKGLVDRTTDAGFTMKEVSEDKGYLGADNMLATLQRGAVPYIPFKTNSVPQSNYTPKSQLWTRMYHFYMMNRPEFLEHYNSGGMPHDQIEVWAETSSKTLTAQINEALCKVLCHNLCVVIQSMHELNIHA